MTRRDLLRNGGLALASFGVGGCAKFAPRHAARRGGAPAEAIRAPRMPINLAPVNASWDRVIRTTIGLRPHRDSGFVLRADKLDDKLLVHNYGHGGAGMSLAWGCGSMVADFAMQQSERRVAVLGCGSPGLTAARQLQRRGFQVTIYAMSIPPDTTSNMSLAGYTPVSGLVSPDKRTPAWDAQFREAAEISYRQLQLMVGAGYGVYWQDAYSATDNPNGGGGGGGGNNEGTGDLLPEHLRGPQNREVLGPGEHPFPSQYAIRRTNLRIEPSIYLEALVRDVWRNGGRIEIRKFVTPRDLMSLAEPVIVNCTGLGSKSLFNDDELVPVKGQLTVLVPQSEVTYSASGRPPGMPAPPPGAPGGGGGGAFNPNNATMNARSDGLVIGNMMERGNWSLDINEEVRKRVVDAAVKFFSAMQAAKPDLPLTRADAPASPPRVDSFFDLES
jgi:glycine/D-amino acid oxidase-like deaminating enzyme